MGAGHFLHCTPNDLTDWTPEKSSSYDVIFDDDSSGEAADVITIKVNDEKRVISVEFYHCKFSGEELPGARIDDLYQVCGQSQQSIRWLINSRELFLHLYRAARKKDGWKANRHALKEAIRTNSTRSLKKAVFTKPN